MTQLTLYLGIDHRELDAAKVAESSAQAYASRPLRVEYLEHLALRKRGWFNREWRIDEAGVMWDVLDGKPFSTQFAHSRFLTPLLAQNDGRTGWAMFADSDVLFLEDPWKILKEVDNNKTVMVVPHQYAPEATVKMDGQPQSVYGRKLWSAVMLWNLNRTKWFPTIEMVNQADGGHLHRFEWMPTNEIGFLSESWQWLPSESPTTVAARQQEAEGKGCPINLVHFTTGVPGMENRKATGFDQTWRDELKNYYRTY